MRAQHERSEAIVKEAIRAKSLFSEGFAASVKKMETKPSIWARVWRLLGFASQTTETVTIT